MLLNCEFHKKTFSGMSGFINCVLQLNEDVDLIFLLYLICPASFSNISCLVHYLILFIFNKK